MSANAPPPLAFDPDRSVVVAVGGNLPGPAPSVQAGLEAALDQFAAAHLHILARSGWWRSVAWPDPTDPPFLNGVVLLRTNLDPEATLSALHRIEERFGRRRSLQNAPRPLDLDLIAHGRTVKAGPHLVIPHPRAHERLFVMGPLAEIAPAWTHPSNGRTAADLAAAATIGADAAPLSA